MCVCSPTVSVLEDDAEAVSTQKLVVVHDPQRLHLGVHVATALHTEGHERGQGEGKHRERERKEKLNKKPRTTQPQTLLWFLGRL
jgi:hypothetical protein